MTRGAHGDGKHLGPGAKGKGAGTGAMTEAQDKLIGENMVLSNRDKTEHSRDRGQDSKWIQTEQLKDHAANKGRG
ncbi:hypothetical protein V1294_004728 [Bradyrhizobium sp. AZCC 1678]|uniref:Uncharacterized protein n=1 Tax=Bradyrhizobium algeriense TaxID=634784 RepID=A0ABU8B9N7_9BRAD